VKSFTLTELSRNSGEIVEAAFAGPVVLTKHGKSKLVVLPAALYETLTKSTGDPRVVRYSHEIEDDKERGLLLAALDARIAATEARDDQ
jgi:antitoxin Phd